MRENLKKSQILETPQAQEAVGAMQVSGSEYEKKMIKVNEHIDIVKERLQKDTFNRRYQEQLQNMYKLQAVGLALKDMVVVAGEEDFVVEEVTNAVVTPVDPSQVTPLLDSP